MKKLLNWDVFGIGTSVLCAVHCSVLPLFLFFGLLRNQESCNHESLTDHWFLVLAIIFAFFAFRKDILSLNFTFPITLVIIGLALLATSLLLPHSLSHFFSVAGGLTMLFAHYKNYQTAHS